MKLGDFSLFTFYVEAFFNSVSHSELQEKEEKDENHRKSCLKRTQGKNVCLLTLDIKPFRS